MDAFASVFNRQLRDHTSHYSSVFGLPLAGRRVWVFPPEQLIRRFVPHILKAADSDANAACLMLVPLMPYSSWWGMRRHFRVLCSYKPGQRIFIDGAPPADRTGGVFLAKRPFKLWWLPTGSYSRTVHTTQLRSAQRRRASSLLRSGRHVDLTVEDV